MFCRVCGFRVRVWKSNTELPEVSGVGMKVLQNFQKFRVLLHGRTKLTEVPGGYKRCYTRTRVLWHGVYRTRRSSGYGYYCPTGIT